MQIIDEIIKEPAGGAHRNKEQAILSIKKALMKYLEEFKKYTREEIFEQRKKKFLNIGKEKTFTVFSKGASWIRKDNFFTFIKEILFKFKKELVIVTLLMLMAFLFLF
jgi:acetyl-CoA carboxylase carboxyl transferase subunit alpha